MKSLPFVLWPCAVLLVAGSLLWRSRQELAVVDPRGRNPVIATYDGTRSLEAASESSVPNRRRPWEEAATPDVFRAPRLEVRNGIWRRADEHRIDSRRERLGRSVRVYPVSLQRTLFRLQLVGYGTDAAGVFGTFRNERTNEVFTARAGSRLDVLGLVVETLTLPSAGEWLETRHASPNAACALVLDLHTGVRTRLLSTERQCEGPTTVWVAVEGDQGVTTGFRTRLDEPAWVEGGVYCLDTDRGDGRLAWTALDEEGAEIGTEAYAVEPDGRLRRDYDGTL